MKIIYNFIKRNMFSCICVLLALAVFLTGTVSFSKYISKNTTNNTPNVCNFTCSATVDDVSSLSFTNTAFWSDLSTTDKVAMNTLRSLDFTVNNFEIINGKKTVCEVKMDYTLIFCAPANFIEKLAIQLFDEESEAILPQLVLSELFSKADGEKFYTASSADFKAEPATDLVFDISRSNDVLKAKCDSAELTFESITQEITQTMQFRLWDVSSEVDKNNPTIEDEGGKLLSPLTINYTSEVECYKVTIAMPGFTFKPSVEQTHKYRIKIAPTALIDDVFLGGFFLNEDRTPITELYAHEEHIDIVSVHEKLTDADAETGEIYDISETIPGNLKVYIVGEEIVHQAKSNTTTIANHKTTTSTSTQTLETKTTDSHDRSIIVSQQGNTTRYSATRTVTTRYNKITTTVETYDSIHNENFENHHVLTNTVSQDGNTVTQTITKTITSDSRTDKVTITTVEQQEWLKVTEQSGTYSVRNNSNGTYSFTGAITTVSDEAIGELTSSTNTEIDEGEIEEIVTVTVLDRLIERTVVITLIDVEHVSRVIDGEYVEYFKDTPLSLFETVEIDGEMVTLQKYFISQSYSKNYPFTVNVLFEQVQ